MYRDFPRANLCACTGIFLGQIWGRLSAPVFPKWKQKFPNFMCNFPMYDFVLRFGEKFMKIAPKITEL